MDASEAGKPPGAEPKPLAVLAFSGGLDTSFCVVYLREQGYDVATVTVDTGGFGEAELAAMPARSAELGAVSHKTVDGRGYLFDKFLKYLLFANAQRGALYPLSVSAERICQAALVAIEARTMGARAIAHGSTGAGNDQVRFDVAFHALAPELAVLTPIRELALSRAEETDYLRSRGFAVSDKTRDYSVNVGMWGSTVGGKETLGSWDALPEAVYPGAEKRDAGAAARTLSVGFAGGVPTSLDGVAMGPVELVLSLKAIGETYGIGKGIHLGDTILGIKGRVGFESPAPMLLLGAHRELEKLVLSGKQAFWKETLGNLYGSMVHEGHYFDPLCRDLEAFLTSSQEVVTGEVRLRLDEGRFFVEGVRSPFSMMNPEVASYGESNKRWTGAEAAGFAKLYGNQQVLALKARALGSREKKVL